MPKTDVEIANAIYANMVSATANELMNKDGTIKFASVAPAINAIIGFGAELAFKAQVPIGDFVKAARGFYEIAEKSHEEDNRAEAT